MASETVTGCTCMGGVVHCGYLSPWRYFLRQVSRSTLCFLPYIECAPIQRSSRQGQSVKLFPTYEADERYGGLKLVDRAMLVVCLRQRQLLVRNLRSRFGKKIVGLLNSKIANTRRYFR